MGGNAARMDAIYARQRHIYDLTRKYYLLGRDRLIARLAVPQDGTVLEVGCGTGRNLIAVAKRYPTATLFGLDISEEMLTTARAKVAAAGLADRITLKQADATDFDPQALFGIARFDRVFFSYTLSMIPDWRGAIGQGAKATGGALHLVDFGQFEKLPTWFGRMMFAWLAKFDVTPRDALHDAIGAAAAENGLTPLFEPLYRGYAWSAALARGQ
ncbi:MAG: class I SAM-dependent methyltransferase [Pseudomonadota bacterium]